MWRTATVARASVLRCGGVAVRQVPATIGGVSPRRCLAAVRHVSSRHGVPLTAQSQTAVDQYDDAVSAYLGQRGPAAELAATAASSDPSCLMAHCLAAYLRALSCAHSGADPGLHAAAQAVAALAGGQSSLSHREQCHAAAVQAVVAGHWRVAASLWEGSLLQQPVDALTTRLLHDTYMLLGDATNLHNSVARVMPRWEAGMPEYCRLVGMYAFGCQEAGALERAEQLAMRNLHMDPFDTWSVHTMTHVHEQGCRRNEGLRFLREMEEYWEDADALRVHLHAHWALFYLEDAEADKAVRRFDAFVRAEPARGPSDLVDATQLLWRLELQGVDVGDRWQAVAADWEAFLGTHASPFADAHMAMALVAAGHHDALVDHMTSARDHALRPWCDASAPHPRGSDGNTAGSPPAHQQQHGDAAGAVPFSTVPVLPVPREPGTHWWTTGQWDFPAAAGTGAAPPPSVPCLVPGRRQEADTQLAAACVGLTLYDGLVAYRTGAYDTATQLLLAVRDALPHVGGCHTERDVFDQTLAAAATQAEQLPLARALMSERVTTRSGSPNAWFHYSSVLSAMGCEEDAAGARDQAYVLAVQHRYKLHSHATPDCAP